LESVWWRTRSCHAYSGSFSSCAFTIKKKFLCIQLKSTFIFLPSILGISGSEAQTGSSGVSLLLFAGILVKMHKNIYSVLFTARDN
jgi:hypothetical protein